MIGRPTRRWWAGLLVGVLALVVAGVGVALVVGHEDPADPCAPDTVARDATSPLLTPDQMDAQPDERLDVLRGAIGALSAPFGEVLAGVGFDYGQWLRLYGIDGAVIAWTKNNAPVTFLDPDDLTAQWRLKPRTSRTAWDAAGGRFLMLGLAEGKPTSVSAYDIEDARRVWCHSLAQPHADGDPVSTTFVAPSDPAGDVVVALPERDGDGMVLTRLSGEDGLVQWRRRSPDVDRADFVGMLTDDVLVAGGREGFRLAESHRGAGATVAGFDADEGTVLWTHVPAEDTATHVVGVTAGLVVLLERHGAETTLTALDDAGEVRWTRRLEIPGYDSAMRGSTVLVRSEEELQAYDALTGEPRWVREIPTDHTYFPYGFQLGSIPTLDAEHVLLPTTSSVEVLSLVDGTSTTYPLPVDGISTTWWPYQLVATPGLIGVVTNTGGVVVAREPVDAPADEPPGGQ